VVAALTAAPPTAVLPHSSPPPLSDWGRAPPPLVAGKGAGSATAGSPGTATAAVAPAIAATATGSGCNGGGGGGGLWSMAPPSPLPPLAGLRTAADAPAGDGGAEFDGGLPAAASAAANCRARGDRDGWDGRPAAVCTSGGAGFFVCLSLGGGGAAVTAAAWAAAAAVLVGGGLFAEDAGPREGGGSRGFVVGGCFACCKQVQVNSAHAFSPGLKDRVLSNMRIGAPSLHFFRASARRGSSCEKAGWPRRVLARLRRTSPYSESDMVRSVTLQRISACVLAALVYVGRL